MEKLMNIEHPKSNIQHRIAATSPLDIGCWMLNVGCFPAFVSLLLFFTGCSPRTVGPPETPKTPSHFSWESYPLTNRLRLAVLPCRVQARNSISIASPASGQLRLHVSTTQTNLSRDTVWAEFEPDLIAAEAAVFNEAKNLMEQREQWQHQLELPRQKIKLTRDLWEAERQLTLLQLLSTNQAFAALPWMNSRSALKSSGDEAIVTTQQEVSLLRQSLAYVTASNLVMSGAEAIGSDSEWERRRLEFERRQAQSRLKMPFTGQLSVTLPLSEGVRDYPVNGGQEVAVARDLSVIQIRVALSDPTWAGLPKDNLSASINLSDGRTILATHGAQRIERSQTREEAVYYFDVPADRVTEAINLLGVDMTCDLWYSLPQPMRIAPKLSLVLHQPAAFQNRNWAEGLEKLWPGTKVLAEGQTDLAITGPATEGL